MSDLYLLQLLNQKKSMLFRSVYYEIKALYAGSILGTFWFLIGPLILMFMYSFLYLYIFKIKPENIDKFQYVLYVLSGLIPYLSIIQSLQKGASSLLQNKNILFHTIYPAEFIPIRNVLATTLPMLFSFSIIIIYKLLSFSLAFVHIFTIFYVVNCVVFLIGCTLVLSLATVVVKDIENILQYLFMFLLFITPIGFFPENLSPALRAVLLLNPVYYFIRPFQDLFVYDQLPAVSVTLISLSLSTCLFVIGSRFFRTFKAIAYEFI